MMTGIADSPESPSRLTGESERLRSRVAKGHRGVRRLDVEYRGMISVGPEIPQMPKPDSDNGMLKFEGSGRWDFTLKAILVLVAIGVASVIVMWIVASL